MVTTQTRPQAWQQKALKSGSMAFGAVSFSVSGE
jgi:hypothetical protein